jgi:hypothetical protein
MLLLLLLLLPALPTHLKIGTTPVELSKRSHNNQVGQYSILSAQAARQAHTVGRHGGGGGRHERGGGGSSSSSISVHRLGCGAEVRKQNWKLACLYLVTRTFGSFGGHDMKQKFVNQNAVPLFLKPAVVSSSHCHSDVSCEDLEHCKSVL